MFDGNALDKTTELLAIEMSKLGYPFAHATPPHRSAMPTARRIDVAFVIDQGPRTYVERIEIHGNTRTRDYVIRREFDIRRRRSLQQDPDRSGGAASEEPELFQDREDHRTSQGSTPDRVVLDVEAVDQSTGDFNIAGGYSTTDGCAGRGQGRRAQLLRHRERRPGHLHLRPVCARDRSLGVGALFSRHQGRGRHRAVRPAKPTPTVTSPMAAPPMARHFSWARRSTSSSACSGATRSTTRTSRSRRTAQA